MNEKIAVRRKAVGITLTAIKKQIAAVMGKERSALCKKFRANGLLGPTQKGGA